MMKGMFEEEPVGLELIEDYELEKLNIENLGSSDSMPSSLCYI